MNDDLEDVKMLIAMLLDELAKLLEQCEAKLKTIDKALWSTIKPPSPTTRVRRGSIVDRTIYLLEVEGKPLSLSEISRRLECSKGSVAPSLMRAVRRGALIKPSHGMYALPSAKPK